MHEYLTDILGNTAIVHTEINDYSAMYKDTKLTNTRKLSIEELIVEINDKQEHLLVIESTMFAPYAYGRMDIIELSAYNSKNN